MPSKAVEKFEDRKEDFFVKDFGGVNLQAQRTAIAENEFSWLENYLPVGYANLRVVPQQGSAVATIAAVTITYWIYGNIANVDYLFAFTSGGGGYQINLSSFAVTNFAAGGTFTGTVAAAQWKNERILIIASNNYWDWNGAALTVLGGTTGAPVAGQTIETFAGRVWIGNARTISGSAPNSYTDFQTASSGFSFIITDQVLRSNIIRLYAANNFLYVFGISSINVISDVRLGSGAPAPTLFSNTNISALIGTSYAQTVFPYGRTIAFATPFGFYALYGATPRKLSDHLDNLFPLIDFSFTPSGGIANIYQILIAAFMVKYNDPAGARPLIAMFFNGRWCFASQGASLTLLCGAFQSGVPAIFGTDGTNIYKLFSHTTNAISSRFQTALWPLKQPTRTKQSLKAGIELTTPNSTVGITLTVDTDLGTISQTLSSTNTGQWFNAANVLGNWVNGAAVTGEWVSAGFQIYQGDIQAYGRYIGYTGDSTAPGFTVHGALLQHERRANWAARR